MNERILIIGGSGMLGHKLLQTLSRDFETFATIRGRLSELSAIPLFNSENTVEGVAVDREDLVRKAIARIRPDVVINAAGIIKQLPSSKNVVETLSVNSIFPHKLVEMASDVGFHLICISTDCVFDGRRGNYSESDTADALDLYGQSKHFGEVTDANCLTLRTSIIGRELFTAHSLLEWFLSNRGGKVRGYVNAIYSGFPTIVFADIISGLVKHHPDLSGLYHVSSEPISKFDLLRLINERFGAGIETTAETDLIIDRSLDSAKFRSETGFQPETWERMIDEMASDPTPYDQWKQ